jgi:hypothetical protein
MTEEPAQFSAFISYASPDKAKADEVCASLEAHGFNCWIAPRNIRAGHDYADAIIKGIHSSKCLILILSQAANDSPFVHREVERAVSANKMIFPMRIQEVLPSAALELFVSSAHWIDAWKGKLDDHVALLVRDLSDDQSVVKTAPPPPPPKKKSPILWIAIAAIVVLGALGAVATRLTGHSSTDNSPTTSTPAPAPAPIAPAPVAQVTPAAPAATPLTTLAPPPPPPRPATPTPQIPKPPGAIELTPSSTPDGQQPLVVYEIYRFYQGKLEYSFLCPPNTQTIRVSYDGQGYFETPARPNPRPYPMTLQDWPAGEDLRLVFKSPDGTETGPFEFAHQNREVIILAALKSDFLSRSQTSIGAFFIPFTLPFTDDPKQQLAAAQAETDPATRQQLMATYRTTMQKQGYVNNQLRSVGCSFVTAAPTVACVPDARLQLMDWAAVKEIHIGDKTGQTQIVVPVNIDWNQYLKDGNDYWTENPDLVRARFNIWNALLPPDATDIYATFIFRDGSSSDEMRFRVDTTRLHLQQ